MTSPRVQQILDMLDAGKRPVEIVAATGLSSAYVYTVLRTHRPDRPRARRTRTSAKVPMILGLSVRHSVERVAVLCDCSEAYVYRVLQRERP